MKKEIPMGGNIHCLIFVAEPPDSIYMWLWADSPGYNVLLFSGKLANKSVKPEDEYKAGDKLGSG